MSALTPERRQSEEHQVRELAQLLKELMTAFPLSVPVESIRFATDAERFANLIRDAKTPELAAAAVGKAESKRMQWTELAQQILKEAEAKLKRTGEELRAVAGRGGTSVFGAIGEIATEAEVGYEAFLAADTIQKKWRVYIGVEDSRARWLTRMEDLHASVSDGNESQAPTDVPDPADPVCEFVEDKEDNEEESCMTSTQMASGYPGSGSAFGGFGGSFGSSFGSRGGCIASQPAASRPSESASAVATPAPVEDEEEEPEVVDLTQRRVPEAPALNANMTPEEAKEQLIKYLKDEQEGLLVTLRNAVAKVKADDRFEGVHEEAARLSDQMELAAGALIPENLVQDFADDLTGAEDKLKAMVEPMRKAQWGGFYAKQAAFKVRKYDLYVAKGKMPKLKDEHPELLECAVVAVDLAEYLRQQAQGAIMDSVTGLVAQTGL